MCRLALAKDRLFGGCTHIRAVCQKYHLHGYLGV